jgi:hypothetical protein
MRVSAIVIPTASFVLVGAVTFALTSTPVESELSAAPSSSQESPTPVGVSVPFAFTGDPLIAAQQWVNDDTAARDQASDENVAVGQYEYYLPAAESQPAPTDSESDSDSDSDSVPPGGGAIPLAPSDSAEPAFEGIVDLCTESTDEDWCPEGVGGTILFSLETMPPFDGMVSVNPHHPGTAPYPYYPECASRDLAPGQALVGITVNRPATFEISLSTPRGTGWSERAVSGTTSDEANAAWQAWFDSDEATLTDAEQWIHSCIVVSDLDPGLYEVTAELTDALNDTVTFTYPREGSLSLRVGDATGALPTQERRPTVVTTHNVDRVIVNATYDSTSEWITMRAVRMADGWLGSDVTCRPELAAPSAPLSRDVRLGMPLHLDTIPEGVREADDYPYFPHHDSSTTQEVGLEEGTDYTLCLFWTDTRGGRTEITAVEAIPVSTPEAYRVTVEVSGVFDSWGALNGRDVSTVEVRGGRPAGGVPGALLECREPLTATVPATSGDLWGTSDLTLCSELTGVDGFVRHGGVRISTQVSGASGVSFYGETIALVDPRCPSSDCVPRDSEVAMVPLAEVPIAIAQCRSGYGGGCSTDAPSRSAGYLSVLVHYTHTTGNGLRDFHVGDPQSDDVVPGPVKPSVELVPRTLKRIVTDDLTQGVRVEVDITAYSDATQGVDLQLLPGTPGTDLCLVGAQRELGVAGGSGPVSVSPRGAGVTRTLRGLCAGAAYRLVALDDEGEPIPVLTPGGWDTTTSLPFETDMIEMGVNGRLHSGNPNSGAAQQTVRAGLYMNSPHTEGSLGVRVEPYFDEDDMPSLEDEGYAFNPGRDSACINGPVSPAKFQQAFRDTIMVAHNQPIEIYAIVYYRSNLYNRDAGEYECVSRRGLEMGVEVRAEVTLEELRAGVVLENELDEHRGADPETSIRVRLSSN